MYETADLRNKSKKKLCCWDEGDRLYHPYRASYDNHSKIEAEGVFVYGMLRHFTYVAGVFFYFPFFSSFLLLSTFFFSTLDIVSTWDWQVDIRTPAKKVMRTYLGGVTAYHNGEHMRHISWLLIHA